MYVFVIYDFHISFYQHDVNCCLQAGCCECKHMKYRENVRCCNVVTYYWATNAGLDSISSIRPGKL